MEEYEHVSLIFLRREKSEIASRMHDSAKWRRWSIIQVWKKKIRVLCEDIQKNKNRRNANEPVHSMTLDNTKNFAETVDLDVAWEYDIDKVLS